MSVAATERASRGEARGRAPFGTTLALMSAVAFAAFLLVMAGIWIVHPPPHVTGYLALGGDQNQGTKTGLYVFGFGVLPPLVLWRVPRMAAAIARGPNGAALPALVSALVAALALAILLVKASALLPWDDGTPTVLVAVALWGALAACVLVRAARSRPWEPAHRLAGSESRVRLLAGLLVLGTVVSVGELKTVSPLGLAVALVLALAVLADWARMRRRAVRGRLGVALDVALGALVLLAVPDVVIFPPAAGIPNLLTRIGIMQFHHDFLLGPANQLLAGGTLLVDQPVSQYGVGSIYALAGWFHIAPVGYGTLGLFDGLFTALVWVAGYAVLRLARCPRPLAAGAVAVGVVVLVYNFAYPVGGIPQQGPFRFGLPMGVLLAAVAGARFPRRARVANACALGVLAVASLWALEAFVYSLLVYATVVVTHAGIAPPAGRWRRLLREAVVVLGVVVAAHVLFALATLLGSGSLPDWGQYAAFVRAFLLGGEAGSITYGFPRWPPGLAVAVLYGVSALALALLVRRRPDLTEREPSATIAVAGATAYGIALFSYADNRSGTYLLLYVALPALLVAALWLSILLRESSGASTATRRAALAFSLSVAVVLVGTAWPAAGAHFSDSALARAVPGGKGLRPALERLWHLPPIDPRSPVGERLIARYMPKRNRALVLVTPDLGTEILVRSRRANELPLGDPIGESFVSQSRLGVLGDAVARLRPGERMLMDRATLAALATLRAHPSADPLKLFAHTAQAPLEGWALQRIERRFALRPIHRDPTGLVVVELGRR